MRITERWRPTHERDRLGGASWRSRSGRCRPAASGLRGAQAPATWEADLAEGQRLFDELDYEHAVPLLSRAILALEPMAAQQPAARAALVSAYGMRARSLFGLDDPAKARARLPRAARDRSRRSRSPGRCRRAWWRSSTLSRRPVVGSLALAVEPARRDARSERASRSERHVRPRCRSAAGEYTVKATRPRVQARRGEGRRCRGRDEAVLR